MNVEVNTNDLSSCNNPNVSSDIPILGASSPNIPMFHGLELSASLADF